MGVDMKYRHLEKLRLRDPVCGCRQMRLCSVFHVIITMWRGLLAKKIGYGDNKF